MDMYPCAKSMGFKHEIKDFPYIYIYISIHLVHSSHHIYHNLYVHTCNGGPLCTLLRAFHAKVFRGSLELQTLRVKAEAPALY